MKGMTEIQKAIDIIHKLSQSRFGDLVPETPKNALFTPLTRLVRGENGWRAARNDERADAVVDADGLTQNSGEIVDYTGQIVPIEDMLRPLDPCPVSTGETFELPNEISNGGYARQTIRADDEIYGSVSFSIETVEEGGDERRRLYEKARLQEPEPEPVDPSETYRRYCAEGETIGDALARLAKRGWRPRPTVTGFYWVRLGDDLSTCYITTTNAPHLARRGRLFKLIERPEL